MPLILATNVVYKTQEKTIDGILFSWWSKPEGIETLLGEIKNLIEPRTFEIFYTAAILEDCIKNRYSWYLQIVQEEKAKIDELFRDFQGIHNLMVASPNKVHLASCLRQNFRYAQPLKIHPTLSTPTILSYFWESIPSELLPNS